MRSFGHTSRYHRIELLFLAYIEMRRVSTGEDDPSYLSLLYPSSYFALPAADGFLAPPGTFRPIYFDVESPRS